MLWKSCYGSHVVVYSFYWWTNDDKPHHFTQIQRK